MEADFSGYATKAGLKCTDGRTIMPDAFAHQDTQKVPLVWQHGHNDPNNVLGHAVLEKRADGIYAYGFFNDTPTGQSAKVLVQHGDVTFMSIWANQLVERAKQVFHGAIREVSLVLAGANPGAKIDFVNVAHSDGTVDTMDDEAVITTGLELAHSAPTGDIAEKDLAHAEATLQDVYDTLTDEQKNVVHYMIGAALEAANTSTATHGADITKEGSDTMTIAHNVFDKTDDSAKTSKERVYISHDDMKSILGDAKKPGQTLKTAVEGYALAHGITDIELLFPDAKAVSAIPEFDKRRTEWVAQVLNKTTKRPFSRIKSLSADLTFDEARAKGYIKGNFKKEEFFGLQKRITTPTTVYKKQKLDRDDMIDITDFDVVTWLKMEMRLMMDEELARAALVGDGRDPSDEDKIKDPAGANEGAGIRSIANDHELYAATVYVNLLDAESDYMELIETITLNRRFYKGSGTPTFYTTEDVLTRMLLSRDKMGRRNYKNVAEIAADLRVDDIIAVEVMEDQGDLVGIIVNLTDFTFGADRGGELNTFDDFDIDYNQYKYLLETRVSGALTKIRSALVIRQTAAANVVVDPARPAFNSQTNTVTIPAKTGVVYKVAGVTKAAGPLVLTADTTVDAVPASGFYFDNNVDDSWTYDFQA